MRTIQRYSFQEKIVLNKKIYFWNPISSATNKPFPNDVLKVEVYNRKLKGKTDLYGQTYNPSVFYYSLTEFK